MKTNKVKQYQANNSRLNSFLDSYKFYPNNIDFRIISTKAIERFKDLQAFQLNEIRNGMYVFGASKRELLLLKYDLTSKVLTEIENLCIEHNSVTNTATSEVINASLELYKKAHKVFTDIVLTHKKENFDHKFTKVWLEVHEIVHEIIVEKVIDLEGLNLLIFFDEIVNIIAQKMECTLMEIYEIDVHMTKIGHIFKGDFPSDTCLAELRRSKLKLVCSEGENFQDSNLNTNNFMIVLTRQLNDLDKDAERLLRHKLSLYSRTFNFDKFTIKNLTMNKASPRFISTIEEYKEIDFKLSVIT